MKNKNTERQLQKDKTYLKIAEEVGALSFCSRKKVGCIIVEPINDNIISTGFNGTPKGMDNSCEAFDTGETLWYVLHSESNAITKLAKSTLSSQDSTMYITLSPCKDCAKLILQSGIKRIVYNRKHSCQEGIEFLISQGIQCDYIEKDNVDIINDMQKIGRITRQEKIEPKIIDMSEDSEFDEEEMDDLVSEINNKNTSFGPKAGLSINSLVKNISNVWKPKNPFVENKVNDNIEIIENPNAIIQPFQFFILNPSDIDFMYNLIKDTINIPIEEFNQILKESDIRIDVDYVTGIGYQDRLCFIVLELFNYLEFDSHERLILSKQVFDNIKQNNNHSILIPIFKYFPNVFRKWGEDEIPNFSTYEFSVSPNMNELLYRQNMRQQYVKFEL